MTEGTGTDQFLVDKAWGNYRQIEITDAQNADTLYWNGYQLTGGHAEHIDTSGEGANQIFNFGYADDHGVLYEFSAQSPNLTITVPDGTRIILDNWSAKEAGIRLTGQQFDQLSYFGTDPFPTLRKSNIYGDPNSGRLDLTGAHDAMSAPGPLADPAAPSAYSDGSAGFAPRGPGGSFGGAEAVHAAGGLHPWLIEPMTHLTHYA